MAGHDTGIRKIVDQLLGDIDFEHDRMQELRGSDTKGADAKYKPHSDRYAKFIDTYKNVMVKYAEIRKGETLEEDESSSPSSRTGKPKKKKTLLEISRES